MSKYLSLYKQLIHIFHIIDSISLKLLTKLDDISKCNRSRLKLIKYEKWTTKILTKIKLFLENRKFTIKTSCDCYFCNRIGLENVNRSVQRLLDAIPRILKDICEVKSNVKKENQQDVTFLKRLKKCLCQIKNEVERESVSRRTALGRA